MRKLQLLSVIVARNPGGFHTQTLDSRHRVQASWKPSYTSSRFARSCRAPDLNPENFVCQITHVDRRLRKNSACTGVGETTTWKYHASCTLYPGEVLSQPDYPFRGLRNDSGVRSPLQCVVDNVSLLPLRLLSNEGGGVLLKLCLEKNKKKRTGTLYSTCNNALRPADFGGERMRAATFTK